MRPTVSCRVGTYSRLALADSIISYPPSVVAGEIIQDDNVAKAQQLPGASAETMATSVAAPLERQLALISGVTSLSSSSSLGRTSIQVEFELGRNINGAAQDVQTAINAAGGQLPKTLPNPPTYEKVNLADAQLMSIAVTSDDLPISKVDDYVENYVALQLSRITGVGLVDFHGEQKPAVRVQVNPVAISSLGLSLEEVRAAIATATVNSPKGTLDGLRQSLTLDATDQLFDAASFNSVIVAYRKGAPIRVSDIGAAVDRVEDIRQAAWLGNKRAVVIDVHKQPGYNINQTVQLVKDALPELQRTLPPSIKLRILGDRTQTIRASVYDVQVTMALSIALVVLVVFLFLRRASATLIPSVTIPVSLLATCAAGWYIAAIGGRHALRRLRPAPGRDDLRAVRPASRRPGAGAPLPGRCSRSSYPLYIRSSLSGQMVPLSVLTKNGAFGFAVDDQPSGPISFRHAVVQLGPGLFAGQRDRRDTRYGAHHCPARHAYGQISGFGQGVRKIAGQPALLDRGGDFGCLHRSGYPV